MVAPSLGGSVASSVKWGRGNGPCAACCPMQDAGGLKSLGGWALPLPTEGETEVSWNQIAVTWVGHTGT